MQLTDPRPPIDRDNFARIVSERVELLLPMRDAVPGP